MQTCSRSQPYLVVNTHLCQEKPPAAEGEFVEPLHDAPSPPHLPLPFDSREGSSSMSHPLCRVLDDWRRRLARRSPRQSQRQVDFAIGGGGHPSNGGDSSCRGRNIRRTRRTTPNVRCPNHNLLTNLHPRSFQNLHNWNVITGVSHLVHKRRLQPIYSPINNRKRSQ